MARFVLTARAVLAGAVREPGFVFDLADGEKGPHRTVVASDHGANVGGASGALEDVPLYVPYEEPKAAADDAGKAADDTGAQPAAASPASPQPEKPADPT